MPIRPVVLVVDDDPDVREVLALALAGDGMTVVEAATGGEALRIVEGDPTIDLLLTDIMMPGITGTTLAERALAIRPDLKVIFTSAYAAAGPPPGPLIAKPFRLGDLRATVNSVIAGA